MSGSMRIINYNNKQYCFYGESVTVDYIDQDIGSFVEVELFAEEKGGKVSFLGKKIKASISSQEKTSKVKTLKFTTRQRSSKTTFGTRRRLTTLKLVAGGKK
jgi:ribosomal protein L21